MQKNTSRRSANGTGSIRKITSTRNGKTYHYWQARYTEGYDPRTGRQIQRSITGKTQKEVARKLKQVTYEIDRGTYLPPSDMTLEEWLSIWQKDYLGGVKQSTAYLYKTTIELYLLPHLGNIRLDRLTPHLVQGFYNALQSPDREGGPLSPKSVKNVHGILHKALQQAILPGYLKSNPADACILPKVVRGELHPLDENQVAMFLKAIENHVHENLYKITLFTGLREGEVLGLTWDCVDFEHGTLLVKQQLRKEQKKGGEYYLSSPKNNKSRSISLAPTVVQLFRYQKLEQAGKRAIAGEAWQEHNLVFSNRTGGYLSYRTVYDCFKRIMVKIGSPKTGFHDLRHPYVKHTTKKYSLQKQKSQATVSDNLGFLFFISFFREYVFYNHKKWNKT